MGIHAMKRLFFSALATMLLWLPTQVDAAQGRYLEILFLGHNSKHHDADAYHPILAQALALKGIHFTYTVDVNDLNAAHLVKFDGLLIYANITKIGADQEKAMMDFVANGGALIPIHCASYCFHNSDAFIELVGAQFKSHGTGEFDTTTTKPDHPIMKGFKPFRTWDETYVHHRHNDKDRVILQKREAEPWTWVRTHGKGRMFYTAYGHDQRTWGNPGFQELVRRGIVWAVNDKAQAEHAALKLPTLEFSDSDTIANYEKRSPKPKLQAPLSAADSAKLAQVPPGFALSLFAAEPQIKKPLAMCWDAQGRLYVAESIDYPNEINPVEGQGNDTIRICEDTDGDGKADKFTLFTDKLSVPTSIVAVNGGIIVAQAPQFLFLKDTDGDGKADVRETIMQGWGVGDTHAGPANLKYGMDNRIWGSVGYSGYNKDGLRFGAGLFSFKPDGRDLRSETRFSNNTWGLGFSEEFHIFGSTANNTHSVALGITDRHYLSTKTLAGSAGRANMGSKKIDGHYDIRPINDTVRQVDVFKGFTAAAGHNLYTARAYPKWMWNKVGLVTEPTARLLHLARLTPEGSGFKESDAGNLYVSADGWSAPIQAEVGPDGMVWFADWYNFIIQHNPTPNPNRGGYQAKNGRGNAHINPLRDRVYGRIYRVVYTHGKADEPLTLSINNPKALVAALSHPNMLWRTQAQQLLVERKNDDVVPALLKVAGDKGVDDIGLNPGAMHALWTLHGLGKLDGTNTEATAAAVGALRHPSAGVRHTALLVLPRLPASVDAMLAAGSLADKDAKVRLTALLSGAEMPASMKLGAALVADQAKIGTDEWLREGLVIAAARHAEGVLTAAAPTFRAPEKTDKPPEKNLLLNGSFETANGELPKHWRTCEYSGKATAKVVNFGRTGSHCVEVTSTSGADFGVCIEVDVKPKTDYLLSAWIKTKDLRGAVGGSLNVHELQRGALTKGIKGTSDWTKVSKSFNSGGRNRIRINCLFGGWGRSTGTVWYDDVSLVQTNARLDVGNEVLAEAAASYAGPSNSLAGKVATVILGQDTEDAGAAVDLTVEVEVAPSILQFKQKEITVRAGAKVEIIVRNPDQMQHNLVIGKPGSANEIGALADKMVADPKAAELGYVPKTPLVIAATKLIAAGETARLRFTAPTKPGDYPYVCTFPGHWRVMQGVMKVTK
jgi:putative membrane-bound dehydrogenase-like protein